MRTVPLDKPEQKRRARTPFWSTGAVRGVAEGVLLSVALSFAAYHLAGRIQDGTIQALALGPLCAILCALRVRLRTGTRRTVLRGETATGIWFAGLASVPGVFVLSAGSVGPDGLLAYPLLCAWNLGAFVFFRVVSYLWPLWTDLRRSRLRWEMTHMILLVAGSVSAVFILLFVAIVLFGGLGPALLTTLLPVVGIVVFLTVVTVVLLLPFAALFSYFAARRTALRLEDLAHGTSGLRQGNFDVRVEVDGEDEVSELQKDFNAMADDLGAAVRDLRSERDNVERLLKTQRQLVANVSHELRTPVATMRGYLESALKGDDDRIPQDLRNDLEVVGRETVRLQRLIDDLFVLSRTEAGQLPLEIKPTDVNAVLSRCSDAVSGPAWRTGKVETVRDLDPNLPPALADEGRLEQSVRNLLSNAVRHTPPGGIVAVGSAADRDAVVVEVKDTGEGIAPEDLGRVFERFYRSDGARELDQAGAGLGLTLVKELVEAMNGSVTAESEPGSGSRFTLRLPRA